MRSTLIIASLALTVLAAPVPTPVPVAEQAPSRRDLSDNTAPVEAFIEKRFRRTGDGTLVDSRSIHIDHNARSEENEDDFEVEKRISRLNNNKRASRSTGRKRSEEEDNEETDVEKRTTRFKNNKRSEEVDDEDEVEVEKRSTRFKNNKRSEEVEKRTTRFKNNKRSEEVEADEPVSEKRTNTIRNIYSGVVGLVEALKTRGFSSASSLPVRQPM